MSSQTEITRIQTARDKLRAKFVGLGIVLSTDKIDAMADKVDADLVDQGAVHAKVKEGETYTVPRGWHNGSGVVEGTAGGGSYDLQAKEVTPTKSQQNITSDDGYYGLSGVTVNPIPSQYQDVSGTTAIATDVLSTKVFVAADGTTTSGTMPNNGAIDETLSTTKTSHSVQQGYHNGSGTVKIVLEEKSATPTTSSQNVTPSTGKVLSKVTVAAIPSKYKDSTNVTAKAAEVLSGKKVIGLNGSNVAAEIEGTMANQGAKTLSIDGLTTTSVVIPAGYHNGSGSVSLTSDIENALAAI